MLAAECSVAGMATYLALQQHIAAVLEVLWEAIGQAAERQEAVRSVQHQWTDRREQQCRPGEPQLHGDRLCGGVL